MQAEHAGVISIFSTQSTRWRAVRFLARSNGRLSGRAHERPPPVGPRGQSSSTVPSAAAVAHRAGGQATTCLARRQRSTSEPDACQTLVLSSSRTRPLIWRGRRGKRSGRGCRDRGRPPLPPSPAGRRGPSRCPGATPSWRDLTRCLKLDRWCGVWTNVGGRHVGRGSGGGTGVTQLRAVQGTDWECVSQPPGLTATTSKPLLGVFASRGHSGGGGEWDGTYCAEVYKTLLGRHYTG